MRVTGAQILSDNLRQLALIRAHEAGEELCLCVKCYPWARRWSLTMWARMNTSSPTQQSNHRYDPERNSFHFSEGGRWTSTLRSVKVTRRVRPVGHDRLVAIDRSGLPPISS